MKLRRHRLSTLSLAVLCVAGVLRAEPTVEQLKAMYEESQRQLEESQDRKNQLANENETLRARITELESQLQAIAIQARQAQFLRNQAAVWASFMQQYPALLRRFEAYFIGDPAVLPLLPAAPSPPFFDPRWPFSALNEVAADG